METPRKETSYHSSKSRSHSFDTRTFSIWEYLKVEMFGIGEPGSIEPLAKESIQNFFFVPVMLESYIIFGIFSCFDSLLYVITYLPIRFAFSTYLLLIEICKHIFKLFVSMATMKKVNSKSKFKRYNIFHFHRTHTYDLMRGVMMIMGSVVLRQINMSRVYHFIRGQSIVKLYVLTGMMETMDKLLCSFGIDIFDALHLQTRTQPKSFKLLGRFLIAIAYISLHASLYFLQVTTITVVINSAHEQLYTVLILNNFTELRGFVFKKFDANNLFQLSCSDITERFQMMLFLFATICVALAQSGSQWLEVLPSYLKIVGLMLAGEIVADSVKHAFICKFNGVNPQTYSDFAYILSRDIISNQKDTVILDHTYSVTRRLGLSQIPLGCVCIRYFTLAISSPSFQVYFSNQSSYALILDVLLFYVFLVILKIIVGISLVFYAGRIYNFNNQLFDLFSFDTTNHFDTKTLSTNKINNNSNEALNINHRNSSNKSFTSKAIEEYQQLNPNKIDETPIEQRRKLIGELAGIERYTVYKGRIMG